MQTGPNMPRVGRFLINPKARSQFVPQDPRERDYLKTILHRIYGRGRSGNGKHLHHLHPFAHKMHKGVIEIPH